MKPAVGGKVRLKKVLHVPALTMNLMSGTAIMANEKLRVECDSSGIKVKDKKSGDVLVIA